MDDRPKEDEAKKKPYEKPEVRRVPLRPEEAILGFCKQSGTGSAGPLSSPYCSTTPCPTSGS